MHSSDDNDWPVHSLLFSLHEPLTSSAMTTFLPPFPVERFSDTLENKYKVVDLATLNLLVGLRLLVSPPTLEGVFGAVFSQRVTQGFPERQPTIVETPDT